jgi:hypothetical protein
VVVSDTTFKRGGYEGPQAVPTRPSGKKVRRSVVKKVWVERWSWERS